MKNIIQTLLSIATVILLFSCDKIDSPIQKGTQTIDNGDSTTIKRRVLIEEFTGHTCTNCPQGAAEIERLVGVYGNQLIPISIHSDPTFALPRIDPVSGEPLYFIDGVAAYSTDFRTPEGDMYYTTFNVSGIPKGLVSRLNNGEATSLGQWESKILEIKDTEPLAEVTIETSYNESSREVTANIETEWLKDGGSDSYKLQVYIIEDHVTDWQLNAGVDISDYDHRHVLRAVVNTAWGETVNTSDVGTTDNKTYNYTLSNDWDEDHCEVVAFVYKEGPDYEVIQANIHHVK